MKRNTMRFYAQVTIVGVLSCVGLLALCGEPADDANFLLTVLGQFIICGAFWFLAGYLAHKWHISRKMKNTKF